MRTELLKINRRIDNYLELVARYETNIEMLRGFREQWLALDSIMKVEKTEKAIQEEKEKINRIYFKLDELNNKFNNLVNNELITLTHQEKEL